MLFTFEGKQPL